MIFDHQHFFYSIVKNRSVQSVMQTAITIADAELTMRSRIRKKPEAAEISGSTGVET